MEDRNALFRASTAIVDVAQLQDKLMAIEDNMLVGQDDDGETCEYDLTKHVVSYLPTPVVEDKSKAIVKGKDKTKKGISKNMKHLGMQSDDNDELAPSLSRSFRAHVGESQVISTDPPFASMFRPDDMRLLALVSHNNMKQSMKQFVIANMQVLKKFRLTGTNTTMKMLKEVFGNDPEVVYGPSCKSGPLGGDAQLVAMAVTGQLGGCIFFIDPMDAHPHSADIECLVRQGNVHNILMMNNPCSAHVCMNTFRVALKMGRMEMIPSFFFDLESPSVEAYKQRQNAVLQNAISQRASILASNISTAILPTREHKVNLAMKRANNQHRSFMMTGTLPDLEFDSSTEEDSDSNEDFLSPGGGSVKRKFSFNFLKACFDA